MGFSTGFLLAPRTLTGRLGAEPSNSFITNSINEGTTALIDTSGLPYIGKFVSLMFFNQHPLMGLIRTKDILRTRKQLEILGSGEIFLQELVQLGNFILVENERWYRREVRNEEAAEEQLTRYYNALFSNNYTRYRFLVLPHIQMMIVYLGLPFILKQISWKKRILLLSTYPLIFVKFIFPTFLDIKWLFFHILKRIGRM